MAKKTYTDPHSQIRNDVLLNLARVKFKKVNYYKFLMVLFAETFGKKNMRMYTGKARGKYMPWEPSIWIANDFTKQKAGDIKKELLSLRVIRTFRKTNIGFNWHFDQWKVEWGVPPVEYSTPTEVLESTPTEVLEYPQEGTKVPPPGYDTPSTLGDSAPRGTVKKEEKKKETVQASFDALWIVWREKIPNKDEAHRSSKEKALEQYTVLVNLKGIAAEEICQKLSHWLLDVMPDKREAARQRGVHTHQFIPTLQSWLQTMVSNLSDSPDGESSTVCQYFKERLEDRRNTPAQKEMLEYQLGECLKKHALKLKEKKNE